MTVAVAALPAVAVMVTPHVTTAPLGGDVLGKVHATPGVVGPTPLAPVIGGMEIMLPPVPQPVRHHQFAGTSGAGQLDPDKAVVVSDARSEAIPLL